MKYRVLKYFTLAPMAPPYKRGDVMDLAPNVAEVLVMRDLVGPVVDEPPVVETAAVADEGVREVPKKRRATKKQSA